jgi:hypothetical protein
MPLLLGKDGATRRALTALWLEANLTNALENAIIVFWNRYMTSATLLKKIGPYPLDPIPIRWGADGSISYFDIVARTWNWESFASMS